MLFGSVLPGLPIPGGKLPDALTPSDRIKSGMNNMQQFGSAGCGGEIYYTIAEVCGLLKISRPTLWRRRLNKIKDGGLVRYRKSVVDKYMADHESGDQSN